MADGNYSDLVFGPRHSTVAPPFEHGTVAEPR
jgi:hypothetical protein